VEITTNREEVEVGIKSTTMNKRVFRNIMSIDLKETTKEAEALKEVEVETEVVTLSLNIRERLENRPRTLSNSNITSSSQPEATTRSHTMKSHTTPSPEKATNITTTWTPWRRTWPQGALKLSRAEERKRLFPSHLDIKDPESRTEVVPSGAIEEETSEVEIKNESYFEREGWAAWFAWFFSQIKLPIQILSIN
jgi:hypothetical protein